MMDENKRNFTYDCRITYDTGRVLTKDLLNVEITLDEYKRIIYGVLEGKDINDIPGIDDVLERMAENVCLVDRYLDSNGRFRDKPLKKPRVIQKMEFFLPESDMWRIKNMSDPKAVFERPEEHMTVYRSDGSYVKISSEFGQVKITDSRKRAINIMDADNFLSSFCW